MTRFLKTGMLTALAGMLLLGGGFAKAQHSGGGGEHAGGTSRGGAGYPAGSHGRPPTSAAGNTGSSPAPVAGQPTAGHAPTGTATSATSKTTAGSTTNSEATNGVAARVPGQPATGVGGTTIAGTHAAVSVHSAVVLGPGGYRGFGYGPGYIYRGYSCCYNPYFDNPYFFNPFFSGGGFYGGFGIGFGLGGLWGGPWYAGGPYYPPLNGPPSGYGAPQDPNSVDPYGNGDEGDNSGNSGGYADGSSSNDMSAPSNDDGPPPDFGEMNAGPDSNSNDSVTADAPNGSPDANGPVATPPNPPIGSANAAPPQSESAS